MAGSPRVNYEVIIKAVPQFKCTAFCSNSEKAKSQARRAWKRVYTKREAIQFESVEVAEVRHGKQ